MPIIGCWYLLGVGSWWFISNIGLISYYVAVVAIGGYTVIAVVPVWRSASAYAGHRLLKYGAKTISAITSCIPLVGVAMVVASIVAIKSGNDPTHDPDRTAEKLAIPSELHPMAGFWKDSCTDNFGLAIAPAEGQLYSVSFCGPGGCFKPGTYRPNTTLAGDASYQVVNRDTLRVLGQDGWSSYLRAPTRESSSCSPG